MSTHETKKIPSNSFSSIVSSIQNKTEATSNTDTTKNKYQTKQSTHIKPGTTYDKIIYLQRILKEELVLKERFTLNKNSILSQMEKNCFQFYKNKLLIQEIFDFAKIQKEEWPSYIIVDDAKLWWGNKYHIIFNMFFYFRNNNRPWIELVNKCSKKNYECLANFIVQCFFENILNPTFVLEDMLVFFYLLLEKLIEKDNKSEGNGAFLFLEQTFLFEIFKSLGRKEDVRSYWIVWLNDLILQMENATESVLTVQLHKIKMMINENKAACRNESIEGSAGVSPKTSSGKVTKSIWDDDEGGKYPNEDFIDNSNYVTNNNPKIENPGDDSLNICLDNQQNEYYVLNEITLPFLENEWQTNANNPGVQEYITNQINIIKNKSNPNIFNNKPLFQTLSSVEYIADATEIWAIHKSNSIQIWDLLDNFNQKLESTLTTIPYTLKCICKIIDILLFNNPSVTECQRTMSILSFLFGNMILPIISNPDYYGIVTDSIISTTTKQNLLTIVKILGQVIKGSLFTNDSDREFTVFNPFIIKSIPVYFKCIQVINNIKLPTSIEKCIGNKDWVNNRDIDYNYFRENINEFIQHQSICFTYNDVLIFIQTIKDNQETFKSISLGSTALVDEIISCDTLIGDLLSNDKNNNKKSYIYICKINYLPDFECKLNIDNKLSYDYSEWNSVKESIFFNTKTSTNVFIQNINKSKSKTIKEKIDVPKDTYTKLKKSICEILSSIENIDKENYGLSFPEDKSETIGSNRHKTISRTFNPHLYNDDATVNHQSPMNVSQEIKFNIILNRVFNKIKSEQKSIPVNLWSWGNSRKIKDKQKISFYSSYLELNINNWSEEYSKNNYSEWFNDLIKEREKFFNITKNIDLVITQWYTRLKNSDKWNMIITNNIVHLKQMEKCLRIKWFVDRIIIPIDIQIKYVDRNVAKIELSEIIKPKKHNGYCDSIPRFIEEFPNCTLYDNKVNIFDYYEETLELDKVLNKYYLILKKNLRQDHKFSKYTPEEFAITNDNWNNYIWSKIYEKVFPSTPTQKDSEFYRKCLQLSWVQPCHLIKDQNVVNENLWITAKNYINNMDKEKTPVGKINCFGKAFAILQNSITFCTGKDELGVDDSIPVWIYVILKSQPKRIHSNFNYARWFIDPELSKKQFGLFLTQMEMFINIIENWKHSDWIGISGEEFNEKINNYNINTIIN